MLLSRSKTQASSVDSKGSKPSTEQASELNLENFLSNRDFVGAITFLKYNKKDDFLDELWTSYCYFHLGEYKQALESYKSLQNTIDDKKKKLKVEWSNRNPSEVKGELIVYQAICEFMIGEHEESKSSLNKYKDVKSKFNKKRSDYNDKLNELVLRLELHLAHKFNDEEAIEKLNKELPESISNQLCLASIHYLRAHYQESIDIYKKSLLDKRELSALPVYLAMCYYKLDYYDVSQEVLNSYLTKYASDSLIAVNLRACNHYRLYNGRAAENELKQLIDNSSPNFSFAKELIRHNLVVFRNGELAYQVLPSLIDIIPEAKLNLAIYYLKQNDIEKANELMIDVKPNLPSEYILKAVVNSAYGQMDKNFNSISSSEYLKKAQQCFQIVGTSASECDTIPGRQCMASCYFLMKQYDDVILYLSSIKSYFYNDDTFNFNYGQAKSAIGNYKEAEEILLLVKSDLITNDSVYINLLIRCFIMNKKPKRAWDLYEKHESSNQSLSYLNLIANDCYKMGLFYFSARAFDILEKVDGNAEYVEGKIGACCALFQLIIAEKESKELLSEIISLLKQSNNQQTEHIIKVMRQWANTNKAF